MKMRSGLKLLLFLIASSFSLLHAREDSSLGPENVLLVKLNTSLGEVPPKDSTPTQTSSLAAPLYEENSSHITTASSSEGKQTWKEWARQTLSSFPASIKDYLTGFRGTLLGIGLLLVILSNPNEIQNIVPSEVALHFVSNYARYFAVNAAHEGGHALANYFINNKTSEIYLGSSHPAEGLEILPHITLTGLHPSKGHSAGMGDVFLSEEELKKEVQALTKEFKNLHPDLITQDLLKHPAYQQALKNAYGKAQNKNFKNRLQFCALATAGALGGLVINSLIKFFKGESLTSLDYVDIQQLINLIPASGLDGGAIAEKGFDLPEINEVGDNTFVPLVMAALFFKALSDLKNQENHPNKVGHALGLAFINFVGLGFFHTTGS